MKESGADEKILQSCIEMNTQLREYKINLIYKNIDKLKKSTKRRNRQTIFYTKKIIEKSINTDNYIRIASSLLKSNYYYDILKNDKKR